MSKFLVVVLLALTAKVFAHSQMTVPAGGYVVKGTPSANTTSPCGFDGNYQNPVQLTAGSYFNVQWPTQGHTGGTVNLRLLDLNKNVVAQVATFASIQDANNNPTTTTNVRIPFSVPNGQYLFQWEWTGYYTCARVDVAAFPFNVTLVGGDGNAVQSTVTPSLTYYNIQPIQTKRGLQVTVNGPTGATFANVYLGGRTVGLPSATNYTEAYNTQAAASVNFGICNDGTTVDNFVAIQGSAGSNDPISVSASDYNNVINVGTSLSFPAHQGFRYFLTQAFETFGAPRRTVIRADSPITTTPFNFILASTDCTFTKNVVTGGLVGVQTACIQLPKGTTATDKYVQVPPMNVGYTISTENGLCTDVSPAWTLSASFAIVLAALFFAM